ncbi:MAG TPA: hypothetical protein ENF32_05865 [Thermosulfidibacter takaii]|uniref:Insertion element IS150 protein InsJ-like helix-turn-helix domain-containing protein n=1 Tax=Thermosulfidibacter takaii TaxID=412593 RepID=A0A7C0U7L5_9BACT|nr:hypothetical protein [Thermosulfidibacter takaii]
MEKLRGGRPTEKLLWFLSILRGETSIQEAARKHGLTVAEVEDWKERFLLAAENALISRPKDEEALREEQIKRLKQKIEELGLIQERVPPRPCPSMG